MVNDEILKLRLHGEGVHPSAFNARDVAVLLHYFEQSLRVYVNHKFPELKSEEYFLSPVEIDDKSLGLFFKPNVPVVFSQAYTALSDAISNNDYKEIPEKSLDHLRKLQRVVRTHNCEVQLIRGNEILASFNGSTTFKAQPVIITEDTTVYAYVQKVGGNEPIVRLIFNNDIAKSIETSVEIVQELGAYVYKEVGLEGTAIWDSATGEIIDLKIKSIIPYKPTSNKVAFDKIRKVVGTYWDDIDDVNETLFND